MQAEIVWRLVHALHQLVRLINDRGAVAPGKRRSKEACDLNVLFSAELPGNGDGIVFDECRTIV